MTQTRVRLWTVNEYHRMFETGIITAEERVELLDGLIPMSATNPAHAATTLCASDYLTQAIASRSCLSSGARSHSVEPIIQNLNQISLLSASIRESTLIIILHPRKSFYCYKNVGNDKPCATLTLTTDCSVLFR